MHIRAEALILAVRAHGEHGAVVRALTADHGLQPGYVRGGRSTRLRPVLQPGNLVVGDWRARTDSQLAALTVELVHSRAPLFERPLPAAAIDWVTVLTAAAVPEAQPYPTVYATLGAILDAVEAAPAARDWAAALVRYELLLLAELGFGLDLSQCAATGVTDDLAWVSPNSGAAVSAAAGEAYRDRLLRLPAFLHQGGVGDWPQILDGLRLTGHFIARDLLTGRPADALAARVRLVDRLNRAVA